MTPPKRNSSRAWAVAIAAAALGLVPAPGALAFEAPPSAGALSSRLAELARPALRTASPAAQARALGLPREGPGSLLRRGDRVLVEVRFDGGAAAAADGLRADGVEVLNASRDYQTLTVAAKPAQLSRLSGLPRVAAAREVLTPVVYASTCPAGKVVSEGLTQLHAGDAAGEARQAFGVDGSGVTVGILSDSFDQATESVEGGPVATKEAQDVKEGDLPGAANTCTGQSTPVNVLDDTETEGEDEGRAMAQIVHDLAPGADLSFATAFTGLTEFAENIEALATEGAEAIADDVAYFEEPFFQEGPVDDAISKVTEGGTAYFSAAGNDNLINGGRDIASWEAPAFRDSGGCPAALAAFEAEEEVFINPHHCMDFNPASGVDPTFGITVAPHATLIADLQWAEAWEAVGTDLDVFLLSSSGALLELEGNDNPTEGRPVEILGWENPSSSSAHVQLVVNRFGGGNPRLKLALLENGFGVSATEYESSQNGDVVGPTIFGHAGGTDTVGVAAIPFDSVTAPEPYSSRGPVTHYFGPVDGTTPAPPLPSPEVVSKPDVTASDCVATSFFAFLEAGTWRFCGTSAAAPHAAAVAALMLDKVPGATPEQIRTAMRASAQPIGGFGPCAVGAGLIEARGAIQLLLTPEEVSPPLCSPPLSPTVEEPVEDGGAQVPPVVTPPPPPPKRPPRTFLRRHPGHVIRTRSRSATAVFRFGSDESGVTFFCRVDGSPIRVCPARFVRRYGVGPHVVRAMARDSDGQVDPTPAVFRFKVEARG